MLPAFLYLRVRDLLAKSFEMGGVVVIASQLLFELRHVQESFHVHQTSQLTHHGHVFGHVQGMRTKGGESFEELLHILNRLNVLIQLGLTLVVVQQPFNSHTQITEVGVALGREKGVLGD